jgi:hypothetical protein
MNNLHAIMVSVDYTDLLSLTLPYNRSHFRHVTIVTSHKDYPNIVPIADAYDAQVLATDLFWHAGASFNKFLALEWGLSRIGRKGWICIMDADVLWPKHASDDLARILRPGFLYSPLRRMFPTIPTSPSEIPSEVEWGNYPVHPNVREHAGYTQIFHADDPVLGSPPWHQCDWKHAGGADSFFQAKWPNDRKIRPTWYVLHLGPCGENWMGRVTPINGTTPPNTEERRGRVSRIWTERRGKEGMDRFRSERYSGDVTLPPL